MQSRQPDCDGGANGACAHSCGYPQWRCGGGDLVFLYRNLAVPESTGKMDEQKPVSPEPETDEDSKVVAPPIAPDGGRTADGLMPLPGEQPVPASADQERISREREKILRELESVPDRLEEPWSRTFSGKPVER